MGHKIELSAEQKRVFDEKNCATRDWTHLASVGMGPVSRERTVQELCPPTNHTF